MLHIIQRTFSFLDSYVLLDLSPQTIQRYSHAGKKFQANIPIFYPLFSGGIKWEHRLEISAMSSVTASQF